MTKKLLLLLSVFLWGTVTMFAQNPVISILGGSTTVGWSGDLDMATTDGVTYTYSSLAVTVPSSDGGVKFRQAHDWTVNWGSTGFPTGTATQNGANIPATNGTYNVTFNRTTGAYSFVPVGVSYDTITLMGSGASYTLTTADGINYSYRGLTLTEGSYMFTINTDVWVGGTGFPTGTASEGISITVPAGTYNVMYNNQTMAYSFGFPTISMIGDAVDGTWDTDIDLTTTDGITYSKMGVTLLAGFIKFREAHAWDNSWGSASFPSGTGVLGGDNIPVVAGVYNVMFNKTTGEYSFMYTTVSLVGDAVDGTWNTDIDLTTTDGITYSKMGVTLLSGDIKFRENHGWDVSWGASSFPMGTADLGGANIPVTAGTYDVTFDRQTRMYNFAVTAGTKAITKNNVTVYPNPSSTAWNFSTQAAELTSVKITDVTGKTIVNQTVNGQTASVNATGLATGVYFASVTANGATTVVRVVKN